MRWQKKLTKKELTHMKEWCNGTLKGLKKNRKSQKETLQQFPDNTEPCRQCRLIAKKLGLEE